MEDLKENVSDILCQFSGTLSFSLHNRLGVPSIPYAVGQFATFLFFCFLFFFKAIIEGMRWKPLSATVWI